MHRSGRGRLVCIGIGDEFADLQQRVVNDVAASLLLL